MPGFLFPDKVEKRTNCTNKKSFLSTYYKGFKWQSYLTWNLLNEYLYTNLKIPTRKANETLAMFRSLSYW